jgi:hypothetical protein
MKEANDCPYNVLNFDNATRNHAMTTEDADYVPELRDEVLMRDHRVGNDGHRYLVT